jgi:hypothetical protein
MHKISPKPGVADPEMEQLIAERVDTFWKGIEGGANKRGQVSLILSAFKHTLKLLKCIDNCYLLREATKEIMVPGLYGRRRRSMGAVVRSILALFWDVLFIYCGRIVNAEMRQPKSERGISSP